MSAPPPAPLRYDLYAVLVHAGHSVHSGHYYCYVRGGNGMWYICDDAHVSQVGRGGHVAGGKEGSRGHGLAAVRCVQ